MNEDNKLVAERRSKLATLRESGNPFVNNFQPKDFAT
jgi:lysyl-tRNA synthetase class 2